MKPCRKFFPAVLALLLGACTVIGGEPVPGWPKLEVVEHRVPHHVMRERCARYVGFGMSPEACAEFDFASSRCHVWFSADFPPPQYVVQHELEHCQGYEHAGESSLRAILADHQGSQSASRGASAPTAKAR